MDKVYKILLADDDPDDQKIISEALSKAIPEVKVHIVDNGDALLEYIRQVQSLPNLIIADIQMPQLTGLEALALIKNDPVLCNVPVVILSTSKEPSDIRQAHLLGAVLYISKPQLFSEWISAMQKVSTLLSV